MNTNIEILEQTFTNVEGKLLRDHPAWLEVRNLLTEIEALRDTVQFVERWAVHHGTKKHMTAQEALSAIQHHPRVRKVTDSYADGKRPETFNPYEKIAELEAALVAQAARTAEQKLRADQMTQQHAMQASMHSQVSAQLAAVQQEVQHGLAEAWEHSAADVENDHSGAGLHFNQGVAEGMRICAKDLRATHPTQQGLDAQQLHADIMNIQAGKHGAAMGMQYREGHRDACHAAAELVLAAQAKQGGE